MSQVTHCDAPDCDATQPAPTTPWPWFAASLQVTTPEHFQEAAEQGWWGTNGEGARVDACSLEHLRIAMARKIAELTDEPAASS